MYLSFSKPLVHTCWCSCVAVDRFPDKVMWLFKNLLILTKYSDCASSCWRRFNACTRMHSLIILMAVTLLAWQHHVLKAKSKYLHYQQQFHVSLALPPFPSLHTNVIHCAQLKIDTTKAHYKLAYKYTCTCTCMVEWQTCMQLQALLNNNLSCIRAFALCVWVCVPFVLHVV